MHGDGIGRREEVGPRRAPSVVVSSKGPFDLPLSLEAAASFLPVVGPVSKVLRAPVHVNGRPRIVEISQSSKAPFLIHASSAPAFDRSRLREIVKWLILSDLDLQPFYTLAAPHPVMGPVVAALIGLKPLRPATLFEMAIIAITEQQLSLAAAFHIRMRVVHRFGTPVDGLWVFPPPEILAVAPLGELRACGLSHRKAEYVRDFARCVVDGTLDLDALIGQSDFQIRQALLRSRGFGEWSVEYILTRGFGRPDCLPAGDVGLRRVVGAYFKGGRCLTATQLERGLSPFSPFRSLAAFYLAVHWRLRRQKANIVA